MSNPCNIHLLYSAVVVSVTLEEEETVAILITRIMVVQEVVVVAAAATTMIVIGLEVVVRIEDLAETTEEVVDLGLVIRHQPVVTAT